MLRKGRTQCYTCLVLRTHNGKYTCNRYLAYIFTNYLCDDWQKRPMALGWEMLELSREDLKIIERYPIRDLQRPFSPKD